MNHFLMKLINLIQGEFLKKDEYIFNDLRSSRSSISSKKLTAENFEIKLNDILYNNTHIYSSEICGLGKTEK